MTTIHMLSVDAMDLFTTQLVLCKHFQHSIQQSPSMSPFGPHLHQKSPPIRQRNLLNDSNTSNNRFMISYQERTPSTNKSVTNIRFYVSFSVQLMGSLDNFWGLKWASQEKCTTKIKCLRTSWIQDDYVNDEGWFTILGVKKVKRLKNNKIIK